MGRLKRTKMGCFPVSELKLSTFLSHVDLTTFVVRSEDHPEGICPFPFYQHPVSSCFS